MGTKLKHRKLTRKDKILARKQKMDKELVKELNNMSIDKLKGNK